MGLREVVQRGVKQAFKAVGNIAEDVTLIETKASGFDFSTGQPSIDPASTVAVKGVFTEESDPDRVPAAHVVGTLLLDAQDVSIPHIYSKANFRGKEWKIVPPHRSNGFTIRLRVSRPI